MVERASNLGVSLLATPLMKKGCTAITLRGQVVWFGLLSEIPTGKTFDRVIVHPDDKDSIVKASLHD